MLKVRVVIQYVICYCCTEPICTNQHENENDFAKLWGNDDVPLKVVPNRQSPVVTLN